MAGASCVEHSLTSPWEGRHERFGSGGGVADRPTDHNLVRESWMGVKGCR